ARVLAGLCTRCERLWLDAPDLRTLVGHTPTTREPLIPTLPTPPAPCPSCHQEAVRDVECDAGELMRCDACGGVLLTRAVLDGLRGSRRAGAVASLAVASTSAAPAPSVEAGVE